MHGRCDTVIPANDAHRLLSTSLRASLLLVDAAHDLRGALAAHEKALTDFLCAAC